MARFVTNPVVHGPFSQTQFLGASVVEVNQTLGWNGGQSSLSVVLVEDTVAGSRVVYDNYGNASVLTNTVDAFNPPPLGSYVFFKYASIEFGGILQNWEYRRSSSGFTYTVLINDLSNILANTHVILNNYSGKTMEVPNILNVYGFLEEFSPTTLTYDSSPYTSQLVNYEPAIYFGGANNSEAGIAWSYVRDALGTIFMNEVAEVFSRQITNITPTLIYYLMTGIPNSSISRFGSLPRLANTRYVLDLSSLPHISDVLKIRGDSTTVMEIIRQVCQYAGCDFFLRTQYLGYYNTSAGYNHLVYIKPITVSRYFQPQAAKIVDSAENTLMSVRLNQGVIQQIITEADGLVVSSNVGVESRDDTTNSFIVGDNRKDIWQTELYATGVGGHDILEGVDFYKHSKEIGTPNASIWYYIGRDVDGNVNPSYGAFGDWLGYVNMSGMFNMGIEQTLSLVSYTAPSGYPSPTTPTFLSSYPLEMAEALAILSDSTGESWKTFIKSKTIFAEKQSLFGENTTFQTIMNGWNDARNAFEIACINNNSEAIATNTAILNEAFTLYTNYINNYYAGVFSIGGYGTKQETNGVGQTSYINGVIENRSHKPYQYANTSKSFFMGMGLASTFDTREKWEHIYQFLRQLVEENFGRKFLVDVPAICAYQPTLQRHIDPNGSTINVNDPFEVISNWELVDGGWAETTLLYSNDNGGYDGTADALYNNLSGWNYNDDAITYMRNDDGTIPALALIAEHTPNQVLAVSGQVTPSFYANLYRFHIDVGEYPKDQYYLRDEKEGIFKIEEEEIVFLDPINKLNPKVLVTMEEPVWTNTIASQTTISGRVSNTRVFSWKTALTPNANPVLDADKKGQRIGDDTFIYSQLPIPHLPKAVALPLLSKTLTYGPWIAAEGMVYDANYESLRLNPAGTTSYQVEPSLNPWTYGSFDGMNAIGMMIAQNTALGQTVVEKGSLTVAGIPNGVKLGDSIVRYGIYLNSAFIGINTYYRTLGPEITSMNMSIGMGGLTTTYTMRTFTPDWEFKNKHFIDNYARNLSLDFRTSFLYRKQSILESRSLIRTSYPGSSAFTKTDAFSRQSSHYVLAGESHPLYNLYDGTTLSTDGTLAQQTSFNTDFRKLGPELEVDTNFYLRKHLMENIGMFRPFTTRMDYATVAALWNTLLIYQPTATGLPIASWTGLDWTTFNLNATQSAIDALAVVTGITTWHSTYLFNYLDFYVGGFEGDRLDYYGVNGLTITGVLDSPSFFTNANSGDYVNFAPTQAVGPHYNDGRLPISVHTLNPFLNDSYPAPYGSGGKNSESGIYLGVSSGHDIEYIVRDGVLPLDLSIATMGVSGYSSDYWYRGIGIRGPMVMVGWGYDVDGYPVPNKNWTDPAILTEAGNSGIADYRSMQFEDRWLEKPHMWKTGPVDLRWDSTRGVWTANSQFKIHLLKSLGSRGNLEDLPINYIDAVVLDDGENERYSIGPTGQIQLMEVAAYDINGTVYAEGEKFFAYYDANMTGVPDCSEPIPNYAKYKVLTGGGGGGIPIYQVETQWPSGDICGELPIGKIVGWSTNGDASRSGEIVAFASGSLPLVSGWVVPALAEGGYRTCSCDNQFAAFSVLAPPHIWEKGTYVGRINQTGFGLRPMVRIDRFNGAYPVVTGCENPSLSGYTDCYVPTATWLAGCLTDNPGAYHGPIEAWASGLPVIITWHPVSNEWEITQAGGFVPQLGTLL